MVAQYGIASPAAVESSQPPKVTKPAKAPKMISAEVAQKALQKHFPDIQVDHLDPAPIEGFYQLTLGSDLAYLSTDLRYLMVGDLIDLKDKQKNLTEQARRVGRLKLLGRIQEKDFIIYKPQKTDYKITVFTDIDCGYCRKMHQMKEQYFGMGIEIQYLPFPRSGKNTPSYAKAVSAWCALDQPQALEQAFHAAESKQGESKKFTARAGCNGAVVDRALALARRFGITGTPTLILPNGALVPGYILPDELLALLKAQEQ
jgi:thiol:disulfide interchange protein DsbC